MRLGRCRGNGRAAAAVSAVEPDGRKHNEKQEEKSVRWRPQREVHDAVRHYPDAARKASDNKAASFGANTADIRDRLPQEQINKRDEAKKAEDASVCQNLQVVVVRALDAKNAVPGIVSGECDSE